MHKYITEFIGTFFLVLTIGLTVTAGTSFAPLAIGTVLMVMVYMGGAVSGAHYNPAVTLSVYLRGAVDGRDVAPYVSAQVLGALLAAACSAYMMGETFAPAPAANVALGAVLLNEFLFTFALCLVILNVATNPETEGNSYFGLAIGFTVMAAAFAGGGISGGAYNPAVGLGPILWNVLTGSGGAANLWIYLVAPFAGGALASVVYHVQHNTATPPVQAEVAA